MNTRPIILKNTPPKLIPLILSELPPMRANASNLLNVTVRFTRPKGEALGEEVEIWYDKDAK